jgi:hypothetical protein
MRRFILHLFSFILLLALAACAGQTAAPTADRGPWTVTPTVYRPPSTVYPPPSTVTPSPTPEPITLANTFGLTGDALNAFSGAEKYITRAENGDYLVTAKVRNQKTGELEEVQYALDPASFDIHPEITNPLGLDTVQAKDADGNPVTLLWLPETHEFRPAIENWQPAYNGVGTSDTLNFNLEAAASMPNFTIEDVQSGYFTRNILYQISRQIENGENLKDILNVDPETLIKNYQDGKTFRLHFDYDNGVKKAYLRSDVNPITGNYQGNNLKGFDGRLFSFELDGQRLVGTVVALFNPQPNEIKGKTPEQIVSDLKNWLFVPIIPVIHDFQKPVTTELFNADLQTTSDYTTGLAGYFSAFFKQHPYDPYLYLYATNDNLDPNDPNTIVFNPELVEVPDPKNPKKTIMVPKGQLSLADPLQSLLAQLLQRNDVYSDPFWSNDIKVRIGELGTEDETGNLITVREVPLAPPDNVLPDKVQRNVLLSIQ